MPDGVEHVGTMFDFTNTYQQDLVSLFKNILKIILKFVPCI